MSSSAGYDPTFGPDGLYAFAARHATPAPRAEHVVQGDPARAFVWYLATPYTDPDPAVRQVRAALATRMTAQLLCSGLNVYSPIAAHHPVSLFMPDAGQPDHAGWMDICYGMLDRCDGVIVSTMDGWRESKGVQLEIKRWKALQGGTQRLVYASPIRTNQPWGPQFSWQAHRVEGL